MIYLLKVNNFAEIPDDLSPVLAMDRNKKFMYRQIDQSSEDSNIIRYVSPDKYDLEGVIQYLVSEGMVVNSCPSIKYHKQIGEFDNENKIFEIGFAKKITSLGVKDAGSVPTLTGPLFGSSEEFSITCNIKYITLPSSITSFYSSSLVNMQQLESLTIPDNVSIIDMYSISECDSLTQLVIPSSIKTFGAGAINCSSLTKIICESSQPASLGESAFGDNENLKIYVPHGSADNYRTAWSSYETKIVEIPDGYVNLGLPSGTLWSEFNLGVDPSTFTAETIFGNRYMWAGTTPWTSESDPQWSDYPYYENESFTKYNNEDAKIIMDDVDDAAYQNISGVGVVSIPTIEQCKELEKYVYPEFVSNYTFKGVSGLNGVVLYKGKTVQEAFKNSDLYLNVPGQGFIPMPDDIWQEFSVYPEDKINEIFTLMTEGISINAFTDFYLDEEGKHQAKYGKDYGFKVLVKTGNTPLLFIPNDGNITYLTRNLYIDEDESSVFDKYSKSNILVVARLIDFIAILATFDHSERYDANYIRPVLTLN